MEVDLDLKEGALQLEKEHLFEMAARVNKKRAFLFVSKVLGKHIPVHPVKPLLVSGLLAMAYAKEQTGKTPLHQDRLVESLKTDDHATLTEAYEALKKEKLSAGKQPIVIGFAETATALGHGVFDVIEGASYIHTTREQLLDFDPALVFEEEHSHATDQLCYADEALLRTDRPIVLVDDEVTTGRTNINIIRDLHAKYPRNSYTILSILDWRTEEHEEAMLQLQEELGIHITALSLLRGQMVFRGKTLDEPAYSYEITEQENRPDLSFHSLQSFFRQVPYSLSHATNLAGHTPYIHETGRFGLNEADTEAIDQAAAEAGLKLKKERKGKLTLCLGTGELMYVPMRLAAHMGDGVLFHSTTRSPIHPVEKDGYAVQNGFAFMSPEDARIQHYVYNIPKDQYDDVFLFFEKKVSQGALLPLVHLFAERHVKHVHIVTLSDEVKVNG
ncbi:phosphoribosyltransferase family protein [Bacillus zhangzhouensis]|uniref:phosphoribosyltransferase family protein n=1 Tax=Bacillus zhangzhouensis TaxID=1178540 RepID=UPI002E1DDA73|nr:phosphoribosyltransferase family protein [Bacillus zhangzhouensis]